MHTTLPNILINGRAGAGKDLIAEYLCDKYGYMQLAFADPIHDIAREVFGMEVKDRALLQDIGQKMREINPDVWVNYTERIANAFNDEGYSVVISDCRQANEYDRFVKNQNYNYLPIRVNADLEDRIQRLIDRDGKTDVDRLENQSETGADNRAYLEIDNNGSVEDLYSTLDEIMKEIQNQNDI